MGVIAVNAIRLFAFHGCLPEEARIGGHYRVDVTVEGDFDKAEHSDELADTVDYGRITQVVIEQMARRSKLIEHVARRIIEALRKEWPLAVRFRVRLVKERPPVAGDVAEVEYVLEG